MAVHVREREPVRVIRQGEGPGNEGSPLLQLTGRRFMGTLFHPVSPGDMQKNFSVFRPGYRITVDWPAGSQAEHPVCGGDRIEVAGRTYHVRGSIERPGCYLDIYVEAA